MKLVCVYNPAATATTLSGAVTAILPPPASQIDATIMVDNFPVFTSIAFTATHGAFAGGGVITGTSIQTSADGMPMVLMGDKTVITLTNPNTGATETATITVVNCNQTSTMAD